MNGSIVLQLLISFRGDRVGPQIAESRSWHAERRSERRLVKLTGLLWRVLGFETFIVLGVVWFWALLQRSLIGDFAKGDFWECK